MYNKILEQKINESAQYNPMRAMLIVMTNSTLNEDERKTILINSTAHGVEI